MSREHPMKRYVMPVLDWDSQPNILRVEIKDGWSEEVKENWRQNKGQIKERLYKEFGEDPSGQKVRDFADIGAKPMSIFSYHNRLLDQCRAAFVIGSYYPALTGVCSLGERVLNHLIIDLHDSYKGTPEYQEATRQETHSNWKFMATTLRSWKVFNSEVADKFKKLARLRQRSVHFNPNLVNSLRADALEALHLFQDIITIQFGTVGSCWAIEGTAGQFFLRKNVETEPFVQKFYVPQCPLVGHCFAIRLGKVSWEYCDFITYEDGNISDEEFRDLFNNRKPEELAPSVDPLPADVQVMRFEFRKRQ